jgi:hypothetical protein
MPMNIRRTLQTAFRLCKLNTPDRQGPRAIKPGAGAADESDKACDVTHRREETVMTPVLDLPPSYQLMTASSAIVVYHEFRSEVDVNDLVHPPLGAPDFPGGIDYDRWARVVRPSPRSAFGDPLDLVDLFDE